MPKKSSRIISLVFAIGTIIALTALIYSFNSYLSAYTALRMFNVSIPEFNVIEHNATNISIETILTLNNPAPQEFYTFYFEQRIYLNGEFFTFTRPSEPSEYHPMQIPSQSSTNVTIDTIVPPTKVEMFQENTTRNWFTSILVLLDGPIIGRYRLTISREIGTS